MPIVNPGTMRARKVAQSAPASFAAKGVVCDSATSSYFSRGGALTGVSDNSKGLISLFFKVPFGNTNVLIDDQGAWTLKYDSSATKKWRLDIWDRAFTSEFVNDFILTNCDDGNWHTLQISYDTNFAAGLKKIKIAYDGSAITPSSTTDTGGAFSAATGFATDWSILPFFDGSVAELYFDVGTFLDVTDPTNNLKFLDADGKPSDLGDDGSTPTGAAPTLYLSVRSGDVAADFATNRGTGGDFTVNGAPSLSDTDPALSV